MFSYIELNKRLIDEALKLKEHVWQEGLIYKVLPKERVYEMKLEVEKYPKIHSTDAMIKELRLEKDDLVLILRNYEKGRSPYWTYRAVI